MKPISKGSLVLLNPNNRFLTSMVRVTAVATSLLMLTVLVVTSSQAAFSDTTANTGNTFASGSVIITDDDTGSAMFTASGMTPGTPVVNCITVTYSGSLVPADIRLYGTTSGALAPYLDTTIEVGTGGSFNSCAGFSGANIYTGLLSDFSTTHFDWTSGLATFTAAANPTSRTFRITADVRNDPAAQSQSATAVFTFEARD
nr:hypothetical protein [uncultured bacterium]